MAEDFGRLLEEVYSWWPPMVELPRKSGTEYASLVDIENMYELQIAPVARATGNSLVIQLDWIVYGAVCAALKITYAVRMSELRVDYLKCRFHSLLLNAGVRQLDGTDEVDGSFNLVELAAYLKSCDLIK
jgi:hypothetical protein